MSWTTTIRKPVSCITKQNKKGNTYFPSALVGYLSFGLNLKPCKKKRDWSFIIFTIKDVQIVKLCAKRAPVCLFMRKRSYFNIDKTIMVLSPYCLFL